MTDPQQELFSALFSALSRYGKTGGIGVYDGALPPDGTPYPFIYMGDSTQSDDASAKGGIFAEITQTVHVYSSDVRKRGTLSGILHWIKNTARSIEKTGHFGWTVTGIYQTVLPDTTTTTPLLHGVLEITYRTLGGKD